MSTDSDPVSHGKRPPLRPLVGLPERAHERSWRATAISVLLHALVVLALVVPAYIAATVDARAEGAGGQGPAGGGGGGTGGTGGLSSITERLHWLRVAPPPPPPAAEPVRTETPVPPPPVPPKPVERTPQPTPTAAQPAITPTPAAAAPLPGTGGGTGNDGSQGSGPGTGGGVGSGVGTGRGSGTGPGTGGGDAEIYPPTVVNLAILPIPVPSKVRPYVMTAYFDVDERGNSTLIGFNPSKDGGYNRRIREMLAELRFRPATRPDGTTVRDTAVLQMEAP